MKETRFYLEYASPADKRRGKHSGNVFAAFVYTDRKRGVHNGYFRLRDGWMIEGIGALFDWPNSPVCGCSAQDEYLRKRCKRISEAKARKIHPALFARLDGWNSKESK